MKIRLSLGPLKCTQAKLGSSDVIKTVVLAALGAVVSFSVSLLLKLIVKHFKK